MLRLLETGSQAGMLKLKEGRRKIEGGRREEECGGRKEGGGRWREEGGRRKGGGMWEEKGGGKKEEGGRRITLALESSQTVESLREPSRWMCSSTRLRGLGALVLLGPLNFGSG